MFKEIIISGLIAMFISSGAAYSSNVDSAVKKMGMQGRVMWFDAEANMEILSTREGVADMVSKCKIARINTIVVDIKPISGFVLYNSKIAPKMQQWKGKPYPKDYDLLRTILDEGHKAGIAVHASMNTFAEGAKTAPGGPAYSHPDWQCIQYDAERVIVAGDDSTYPAAVPDTAFAEDKICSYTSSLAASGGLPMNTRYVSVDSIGIPLQTGVISGTPNIAVPQGGSILTATDDAGKWLAEKATSALTLNYEERPVLIPVSKRPDMHLAVFVNPLNPDVRAYELSLVKEICANYDIDGFVLDRMRYPGMYSDFSDISRKAFESFIGSKVDNWPSDIFKRSIPPASGMTPGPLFKQWTKFRAKVIKDFLIEARNVVKSTRPNALMGIYVGSWYPMYYDVGVNWGSEKHTANYDWWPEGYNETGYAELVDYMCTGCYYTSATRKQALESGEPEWKSVEAASEESLTAVQDATFVYASLYLLQYQREPEKFRAALEECLKKTSGVMFFDLVYVRNYDWWNILAEAFPKEAVAPHDAPGLIEKAKNAALMGNGDL